MKVRQFEYNRIDLCRDCHGVGYLPPDEDGITPVCPVCSGSGRVKKTTKGTVTIEPY
ncbi:MAG: molecular chaperone DnaJ [Paludibacteraceae bacterium]|nr:molecular chaperone DnaJ [Paludibacteraceae bacterium]